MCYFGLTSQPFDRCRPLSYALHMTCTLYNAHHDLYITHTMTIILDYTLWPVYTPWLVSYYTHNDLYLITHTMKQADSDEEVETLKTTITLKLYLTKDIMTYTLLHTPWPMSYYTQLDLYLITHTQHDLYLITHNDLYFITHTPWPVSYIMHTWPVSYYA